ncbi:GtrA family protein [Candidatus Dojkabacteria bacterium]|uniref:GtrA family protein n=1 Tax=Candidatus Dojkabacteria bacterium TaxID=2099670 RepID=A0A955L064_9BACT|nr:GtrA family protein [Candidatus Dojkabacteria bacterium]
MALHLHHFGLNSANMLSMWRNLISRYQKQLRYLAAGSIAFLVDAGSLSFLLYILNFRLVVLDVISIPNVISVSLGLVASYFLNRIWTFAARKERVVSQGSRFVVVFVLTYIVNQLFFGVLTEYAFVHPLVAKVVVTFVQMFTSYVLYSKVVFTEKDIATKA